MFQVTVLAKNDDHSQTGNCEYISGNGCRSLRPRHSQLTRRLFRNTLAVLMLMTGPALQAAPSQTVLPLDPLESIQCEINHSHLSSLSSIEADVLPSNLDQELTVEEESYPDALTAVIAASNYFNPLSIQEDREYIGAILRHKRQGHFIYTVSSGQSGEDTVSARIKVPAEYEITAFWHTHGNHHWTRKYFSDIDTQLAKQWGLPFYMAEASGKLRVYNPDDPTLSSMRSRKMGLGAQSGYAKGRIVSRQQQRVHLATNMNQWLAIHQSPAADQQPSAHPLTASISSHCDSVATNIKTKKSLNQANPNPS